jgi:glycerol-3-phosphate dehydrogenase
MERSHSGLGDLPSRPNDKARKLQQDSLAQATAKHDDWRKKAYSQYSSSAMTLVDRPTLADAEAEESEEQVRRETLLTPLEILALRTQRILKTKL